MSSKIRSACYFVLFLVSALFIWAIAALPSQAHWSDMSAAEILLEQSSAQMNFTYPTGLTPFADDDRNGQLSSGEVMAHQRELTDFLAAAIQLTNGAQVGSLTVQPLPQGTASPVIQAAPQNTHSTLQLTYSWPQPVQALKIRYGLFLPGVSTASCLATILQNQQLKTFVFTPKQQVFAIAPGLDRFGSGGILLAVGGAIVWGAMHSLSPGHGKTLVGAYLVGARATAKHAVFLALTTTVTHTLGIFALGLIAVFASRYILPEQLYPWMNLVSGVMVAVIGGNLFWSRFQKFFGYQSHAGHLHHIHTHDHKSQLDLQTMAYVHGTVQTKLLEPTHQHHDHQHHRHEHYGHDHGHHHDHSHHSGHSHLPPDADGSPITWRSLLALGVSGGLVPCPAALVLLLSCIALGNVGLGLLLVLAFSLGLAAVLTGLGLLMVYAKPLFRHLPTPKGAARLLPTFSAIGIVVIGIGLSAQAALQIAGR
ncbi:MAG: ABC transporter permease [Pegethrix bostrychoides GSE-TBD4-15B]|jgi:ABC-type nickel/cobalt efflux system permease component RcnA|uniref:Nickel/cobalt efflux system n=1 Tax=Pegethrix bostrychoides GSE-TBD4-15B TaxID=2839662 RepID=A0A951U3Y3_9CYAN|nr:ABC transporter permease [Pegethrix bostrychoides GSE-TBD4-15B]